MGRDDSSGADLGVPEGRAAIDGGTEAGPVRKVVVAAVILCLAAALAYVYVSRRPDLGADLPGSAGATAARASAAPGGPTSGQMAVTVITAPVEQRSLAVEIEAVGTTHSREAVDITAKVANTVTAVRFEEGQRVTRGQVLVELDGAQMRADLAAAEAALKESQSTWKRSRDLYARQALSESQLEQIEATLKANEARVASAEARVADTVIRAPFAGTVGLRRISVGSLISPGTVITTLDDSSVIKLDFDVPETFLAVVEPGLPVAASSISYPDEGFTGRVASVDSRVDPVSRSVTVRALVPNDSGLLKPGMFMSVKLSREPTPALVVPEAALVPERGNVYVFVVAGGVVSRREVTVGRREPGWVELTRGAAAGERVVVQGTQRVRDGTPVTESPAGPPADA